MEDSKKKMYIPSSEEDIQILNKILEVVNKKQFIMEKDILKLCKGDNSLCYKTKYCLINTEAIIPATNESGRYNKHPETTERYLRTDYYKTLYEEYKQDEEKKRMEINKLEKDIANMKWQKWISIIALILSAISLFKEYILEYIKKSIL